MNENTLDARGYSCPEPVIMTKKAIEKNGLPLTVLVDSMTPVNNITRFAQNAGYKVSHRELGEDYEISISK